MQYYKCNTSLDPRNLSADEERHMTRAREEVYFTAYCMVKIGLLVFLP